MNREWCRRARDAQERWDEATRIVKIHAPAFEIQEQRRNEVRRLLGMEPIEPRERPYCQWY